jgi:hypothetical protein
MVSRSSDTILPQDGLTRPHEMDIASRMQRRSDSRPEPPEELRKWEAAADRRMCNRPYPPNIMLEEDGSGGTHLTSPHADGSLWTLQLAEAFATRSQAVVTTFVRQLQSLGANRIWDEKAAAWRLDEVELSAMLAIINSLKPRNEMEACLAAQMVAVHLMQMKLSAHAIKYPQDVKTAAVAGKLARTFTGQIDAMQGLKGKRRTVKQTITVRKETHQHVHYHDHRGADESQQRPHATAGGSTAEIPAMPGKDEGGRVVPFAGRSRKARV